MTNNNCNSRAEEAARETNLVKRGVAYNKASQCYKKNDEIEQYKLMKEKAIEAFQKEATKVEDPYEKSLIASYEALCWICLGELENAKALIDKNIELYEKASNYTPPPILNFIKNLASKEVEKAEAIWKDIYQNFLRESLNC